LNHLTPGRVIDSLTPVVIVYCCTVMVIAYSVRGASGFGAAAALPLLGLALPLKLLVPAWTIIAIVAGGALLGSDRRNIAWASMLRLVPGCFVGIAIGLFVFTNLSAQALTKGLGAAVLIYGLFSLWGTIRPAPPKLQIPPRVLAFAGGVGGGFTGTAIGTFGSIFFAMYYDAIKLGKDQYRATMTAILLTLGVSRGIGYWAVGEFTREVLLVTAFLFPSMMVGTLIGARIHHGMSDLTFRRTVAGALIASGLALLVK
jgi:uncharacterized membrane protein YfcA